MSRIFSSNLYKSFIIENNVLSLQIVRWRRKPRWEPIAKSKVFVPERENQLHDEKVELMSLHNKYRTQIKSIRSFLHKEVENSTFSSTYQNSFGISGAQQYLDNSCVQKNIDWNNSISLQREKHIIEQNKTKREFVNNRLQLANYRREINANYGHEVVEIQKENMKYYISESEIYNEIVKALENYQDNLFSIDLKGGVHAD